MQEQGSDKNSFYDETQVLEEFFKLLHLTLKSASMYFRDHPLFMKNVQELKRCLGRVSSFRKILSLEVSQDGMLVDGASLGGAKLVYREVSSFLHKRRIKRLILNTGISFHELGDFVFNLAMSLKAIAEGKSLHQAIGSIEGIKIEELDYSSLLAGAKGYSFDLWKDLFKEESKDFLNKETIRYFIDNLENITRDIKDKVKEKEPLQKLFNNLEEAGPLLGNLPKEDADKFAKNISGALFGLPPDFLNSFLTEGKFARLKEMISKGLDKAVVFNSIVSQLIYSKQYNPLFLNICGALLGKNEAEEKIAEEISQFMIKEGLLKDKEKISETLKELFLSDPSSKFISHLYKNTLSYLTDRSSVLSKRTDILERGAKDLDAENIELAYFYVLLELLNVEDQTQDLKLIVSRIEQELSGMMEKITLRALRDLTELIEEKVKFFKDEEAKDSLKNLHGRVCSSKLQDIILSNIGQIEDLDSAAAILKRIKGAPLNILHKFFRSDRPDIIKKLKNLIQALADEKLINLLGDFLKGKTNPFMLKEAIAMLSNVKTKSSFEYLKDIFNNAQEDKVVKLEILRAMKPNPFKDRDFFENILSDADYFLRREAAESFLDSAGSADKLRLADKLLKVKNFFGLKDRFIIENIEIVRGLKLLEAIACLSALALKGPLLLGKRREPLRIKSIQALAELSPESFSEILPYLIKDRSRTVRNAALKLREKCRS